MTVPASARKAGPFNGNGSTTAFPFSFKVYTDEDIQVVAADADGVESVLVLDSDYSVTLNADQNATPGGTVTYPISGSPLAVGEKLSIVGNVAYDQATDLPTGGNFNPTVLEDALDKLSMQIQQLDEAVARAAKIPVTRPEDAEALAQAIVVAADNIAGLQTIVANIDDIQTVAADLNEPVSEINTVAGSIANVDTVAGAIANVNTVAGNTANIDTVAGNNANVTTVAGISANVTAVAGNATNVNTVATNIASVNSAATNMDAIIAAPAQASAAASSASDAAASAAAAATALDSFDDRYLGSKTSNPTLDNDGNALVTGALYYRSTAPIGMKVYDGSQWIEASAAQQAALVSYEYVATAGQTTFTGADANGLTLSYITGGLIVSLNGAILRPGDEYTATNGTSVVLTSAAALGDELVAYAFSSFQIANTYTQAQIDAALALKANANATVNLTGAQSIAGAKRGTIVALTDGATITPDFAAGNNFSVTLAGNRTLANPTNLTAGQSGVIVITQDGTGSRTLAFGSNWKFASGTAPSLTTTAAAVDVLAYYCESSSRITARLISDVK